MEVINKIWCANPFYKKNENKNNKNVLVRPLGNKVSKAFSGYPEQVMLL